MRIPPFNSLFLCILLATMTVGCGGNAGNSSQSAKKKMTRDEFRALVEGKSRAEILEAVGKPTTTQQSSNGREMWYFKGIAIDPITKKSGGAFIHFDKEPAKARSIAFD